MFPPLVIIGLVIVGIGLAFSEKGVQDSSQGKPGAAPAGDPPPTPAATPDPAEPTKSTP